MKKLAMKKSVCAWAALWLLCGASALAENETLRSYLLPNKSAEMLIMANLSMISA